MGKTLNISKSLRYFVLTARYAFTKSRSRNTRGSTCLESKLASWELNFGFKISTGMQSLLNVAFQLFLVQCSWPSTHSISIISMDRDHIPFTQILEIGPFLSKQGHGIFLELQATKISKKFTTRWLGYSKFVGLYSLHFTTFNLQPNLKYSIFLIGLFTHFVNIINQNFSC